MLSRLLSRTRRVRAMVLVAGALGCLGIAGCDLFTDPEEGPDPRPIVFAQMDPDDGWTLYQITAGSAEPTRLEIVDRTGLYPALTPDGSMLAFVSQTEPRGIYTAFADGTNAHLIREDDLAQNIAWSPGGTRLAIESGGEIVVIDNDGADPRVATGSFMGAAVHPSWSRNGHIAFAGGGFTGLWQMSPDGSGLVPLVEGGGPVRDPAWSPDGSRIAFVRSNALHVMNADGSDERRVIPESVSADVQLAPAWSPSGRWIALEIEREVCEGEVCETRSDIFIVRPDGRDLRNLTGQTELGGSQPAW